MKSLEDIKIDDYQFLKGEFKGWLDKDTVPVIFWDRIKNVSEDKSVVELLHLIDSELMDLYREKRDTAKSFIDSRFSPIDQVIKRGMVSCGALSRVHGAVLRNMGIPVKLVHGRLKGQKGENRHAWLKIYNPKSHKWIAVDPTQDKRDFRIMDTARQTRVYSNWDDMKEDYINGRF